MSHLHSIKSFQQMLVGSTPVTLMVEYIISSLSNEESSIANFIWTKGSSPTTSDVQNRFYFEGWYYAKIIGDLSLLSTKEIRKIHHQGTCYFNAVFKKIKVKYRTLNCFPLFSSAGRIC